MIGKANVGEGEASGWRGGEPRVQRGWELGRPRRGEARTWRWPRLANQLRATARMVTEWESHLVKIQRLSPGGPTSTLCLLRDMRSSV